MQYLYQTEWRATPPEAELSARPINVDVRRRGLDPFFKGIAVGVAATLAGVLVGLFFLLPV